MDWLDTGLDKLDEMTFCVSTLRVIVVLGESIDVLLNGGVRLLR
jgi:hypothetical protein